MKNTTLENAYLKRSEHVRGMRINRFEERQKVERNKVTIKI